MKVLLLGFDRFPGIERNHSSSIIEEIEANQDRIGLQIHRHVLPVSFEKCEAEIKKQVKSYSPDLIVLVGVKFSSSKINLEKVALNIINSYGPDSEGKIVKDALVVPDGREAYFSSLDLNRFEEHLTEEGIPSIISYHAGTYVCNQAYYLACYLLEKIYGKPSAILIHVPRLPNQIPPESREEGLKYNLSRKAVRLCLENIKDESF